MPVREFATPASFRAAVESRLRDHARRLGVPAYMIRRQAALECLIVRLDRVAPHRWALKGGLALETRLGVRARVSVDLDADHVLGADAARGDLQRATVVKAGDHFDFALTGSEGLVDAGVRLAVRYGLESSLAGRPFEPVQVDVTLVPPEPWDGQPAERAGLLSDLGLGPVPVLLIPVERQVAEKLHAYTRVYKGRGTTRAKDVVDLLLIHQLARVDGRRLQEAMVRVFDQRATHPVPESWRVLPANWRSPIARRRVVSEFATELDDGFRLLAAWINPTLRAIQRAARPRNRCRPFDNGRAWARSSGYAPQGLLAVDEGREPRVQGIPVGDGGLQRSRRSAGVDGGIRRALHPATEPTRPRRRLRLRHAQERNLGTPRNGDARPGTPGAGTREDARISSAGERASTRRTSRHRGRRACAGAAVLRTPSCT